MIVVLGALENTYMGMLSCWRVLAQRGEAVFTSPTSVMMLGKVPTSLFFILEETGLG